MATAKARGKDAALNEKRRILRRGSGKEEHTRTHGWVTKMCAAAPDPAVILLGFMERRVWQVERGGGRERMEVTGKSGQVIRMRAPESSTCVLIPALLLAKLEALSLSQHLHLIRWEWQRLLSGVRNVKLLKTQHRVWQTEGAYWKQVIWTETWEKLSFRESLRSTKFFDTPAYIGMPILGWIKCTCMDSTIKQSDSSKISRRLLPRSTTLQHGEMPLRGRERYRKHL